MSDNIQINGVLARFSYGCVSGSKRDEVITQEVREAKHAGQDFGAWSNRLYPAAACGKRNAFTDLRRHLGQMRGWHYANTFQFQETLWRILPEKRVEAYRQVLEIDGKKLAHDLLDSFVEALPILKQLAQTPEGRGDAYREEDYPTPEEIRAKFVYEVEYQPIPSSAGLNPVLFAEAIDKLNALHAQRLKEANETLVKRFLEPFKLLSEQLQDTKKRRIGPVLETIREFTEIIPSLDLSGNTELLELAQTVHVAFESVTVDMLKSDEAMQKLVGETCTQAVSALERFGKAGARSFA